MKKTERTTVFRGPLIELVIMIGVFAVMAVFILRMFMTADRLQGEAVMLSKGSVCAETACEVIKGTQGSGSEESIRLIAQKLQAERAETFDSSDSRCYVVSYDKEWRISKDNPAFLMILSLSAEPGKYDSYLLQGTVEVCRAEWREGTLMRGKEYCKIPIKHFVKGDKS